MQGFRLAGAHRAGAPRKVRAALRAAAISVELVAVVTELPAGEQAISADHQLTLRVTAVCVILIAVVTELAQVDLLKAVPAVRWLANGGAAVSVVLICVIAQLVALGDAIPAAL